MDKPEPMRGLGDFLKHTIEAMISIPGDGCGGCDKRREALNRLFPFNRPASERERDTPPE